MPRFAPLLCSLAGIVLGVACVRAEVVGGVIEDAGVQLRVIGRAGVGIVRGPRARP